MLHVNPVRTRRAGRGGFTVIELMIVIAILMFLIAIAVVAVGGLFSKARANRSLQAIKITMDALNRFREEFPIRELPNGRERGFPIKANWPDQGSVMISEMTDGEWLRLLLYPSEEELKNYLEPLGVTRRIADSQVIQRFLNEYEIAKDAYGNLREIEANKAIVDGWGAPLYYRFPGVSHVMERNSRGMTGANHFMLGLPDIWSAGDDNQSAYGSYGGGQPSIAEMQNWWDPVVNDPGNSGGENVIDDVTNWFGVDSY